MRDRFDAYLVAQAVNAGAELRDGTALPALGEHDTTTVGMLGHIVRLEAENA